MTTLSDFELALKLQQEIDRESAQNEESPQHCYEPEAVESANYSRKRPYSEFDLNGTQQIVHPLWETLDPTPDIFVMFKGFDKKFFQGKLFCVELEWSKKMYSCAGICYQRRNKFGKACTIRLSEPLLKLRSRKNLVETLLHEMIHAYLFVLNVREENGGHGPNFKRIMSNINKAAGTNITVYHTFNDEVKFYKNHIWRCNGVCQHRGPFYGYVTRVSNRAPGKSDRWWNYHQEACGGHFLKVSQPDPVVKPQKEKLKAKIPTNAKTRIDNPRWGMVKKTTSTGTESKVSTKVVNKDVPETLQKNHSTTVKSGQLQTGLSAGRNLSNVVGFKDLNGTSTNSVQTSKTSFPSTGHVLGKPANSSITSLEPKAQVRDFWNKKYTTSFSNTNQSRLSDNKELNPEFAPVTYVPQTSNWVKLDDDIEVQDVVSETITILDDTPTKRFHSSDEQNIKREILDSFDDDITDSDIELIDHDYDDAVGSANENLCNETITDNLFSWNKSTEDLNKIQMSDAENAGNPNKELVCCPVCQIKCEREWMSDHLESCFGSVQKIDPRRAVKPPSKKLKTTEQRGSAQATIGYAQRNRTMTSQQRNEEREYNERILREMESERAAVSIPINIDVDDAEITYCPVCSNSIKICDINDHLDLCLSI